MNMLTIAQLQSLLDTYGADAARWPPEQRVAALELLAGSSQARALHAEARRLDEALGTASARADRQLWPSAGAQQAALARLRAGVAGRISQAPPPQTHPGVLERLASFLQMGGGAGKAGWLAITAAGCVAIFAGFLIGAWYGAPAAGPDDTLLYALQPMPLQLGQ